MKVVRGVVRGMVVGVAGVVAGVAAVVAGVVTWGPVLLLGALGAMLITPPSVEGFAWERVLFVVAAVAVMVRALVRRQVIVPREWMLWPMAGLAGMAVVSAAGRRFDAATWSFLGAKFAAPFAMFYLARLAFDTERGVRWFHAFSAAVLGYLVVVSVAQFAGADWLVWPRYILDESVGIHADRARGPLVQAVANGILLTVMGIAAMDRFRRGELRGRAAAWVLVLLPVAVLGTMTRAVWATFAVAAVAMLWGAGGVKWRAARRWVAVTAAVALVVVVSAAGIRGVFAERMGEAGPVETRVALYRGAWDMFEERPVLGWGFNRSPEVLPDFVEEYKLRAFWAHNTGLEILLEQGVVGAALYAWILWGLWRLGRGGGVAGGISGKAWRWIVVVYVVQGMFVVLNYQFVNAWVFGMAGVIAGRRVGVNYTKEHG